MVYQNEAWTVWSRDFRLAGSLKSLPRDSRPVRHNFPTRGILSLRSPLPSIVLLDRNEALCPYFIIGDTTSALGFHQTIVFNPEFFVDLPGTLSDGRLVHRAVFGWPSLLLSSEAQEWRKILPQASIALDSIVAFAGEERLEAVFVD
jgi:hypothetical protein